MLTVEDAQQKVLSYVDVLEPEEKPLLECSGQVLAEDVYSTIDIPPLDNSAMDGYAVQAKSTRGAAPSAPQILRLISEVAAGYISEDEVSPGTTIRIMTGAPVPKGADAVVPFEDTDEEMRKASGKSLVEIGILRQVPPGLNIRRAREDIAKGDLVLSKGTVLRPQEIGALASLGRTTASVIRRPVVAILATGDELVDVGKPLPPGKIYNSNTFSLAAQVRRYGAIPKILGIARDDIQSLAEAIDQGYDADLFLTSAGVSVGSYDFVKDVLAKHGEIAFWSVCMKPGKPLAFGLLTIRGKRIPHLGLPGNPVSAMVSFEQFARPAILKMLGKKKLAKPTIIAISESHVENSDERRFFTRAIVEKRGEKYFARLTGPQGSGVLTSMVKGNGLMIVPEGTKSIEQGDEVQVQMLDWEEEQ
jgi:molybdopterin molybdotransferase